MLTRTDLMVIFSRDEAIQYNNVYSDLTRSERGKDIKEKYIEWLETSLLKLANGDR